MQSLVSTDWLARHLGADDLAVLDASRHLPAAKRDARAEYRQAHIPGARFLDLETFTDSDAETPAALPNETGLAQRLSALGITPEMRIVIYDDSAVRTAARAWFALKAHGIENVALLDGGFAKWREEGRPTQGGNHDITPATPAKFRPTRAVASKADMLSNLDSHARQVVDARAGDRVFGSGIDPVHGGQNGRIPGSLNVPFGQLYNTDGTFKGPEEIRDIFEKAGVDLTGPITTTCGSGVTACVLIFALDLIGEHDTQLYDGSWQEWEADPATPKAQGAP